MEKEPDSVLFEIEKVETLKQYFFVLKKIELQIEDIDVSLFQTNIKKRLQETEMVFSRDETEFYFSLSVEELQIKIIDLEKIFLDSQCVEDLEKILQLGVFLRCKFPGDSLENEVALKHSLYLLDEYEGGKTDFVLRREADLKTKYAYLLARFYHDFTKAQDLLIQSILTLKKIDYEKQYVELFLLEAYKRLIHVFAKIEKSKPALFLIIETFNLMENSKESVDPLHYLDFYIIGLMNVIDFCKDIASLKKVKLKIEKLLDSFGQKDITEKNYFSDFINQIKENNLDYKKRFSKYKILLESSLLLVLQKMEEEDLDMQKEFNAHLRENECKINRLQESKVLGDSKPEEDAELLFLEENKADLIHQEAKILFQKDKIYC